MPAHGPVVSRSIQRLVSHKDYTVEMVNLIIKDIDLDECDEHATKDLGVSGLFDLARVSIHRVYFSFLFLFLFFFFLFSPYYNHHLFVGNGKDEGPSG